MYACACQIDECVLCEARLYSGLSAEQVCQIRGMLGKQDYRAHAMLFREGEPCRYLYVLRSGQVKLTTALADGREQILGVRVAGQLLGFETLDDDLYPYTATALTPVDACRITHKDMLRILEQNPAVALRVIRRLNRELECAQARIRDLGLKNAHERVASFILSLAPERGEPPAALPLVLSRQEMADLLGLTIETVSRVIAELKRGGIIQPVRGAIRILDEERLASLANGSARHRDTARRAAVTPALGFAARQQQ